MTKEVFIAYQKAWYSTYIDNRKVIHDGIIRARAERNEDVFLLKALVCLDLTMKSLSEPIFKIDNVNPDQRD
jgi:hypothetical protein